MGATPDESNDDKDHPDNKKLAHEGWNSLTEKSRSCTDCPCILLLCAMWFAMTVLGFIATGAIQSDSMKAGNPARLLNPMDYDGRICGYTDGVKNKEYGYYMPDTSIVCVSSCPGATDNTKFICKDDVSVSSVADGFTNTMAGDCMWEMASTGVLNRCYIDGSFDVILSEAETVAAANGVTLAGISAPSESGTSGSGFITDFLGDVYGFSGYIFGFGIGVATVVAFLYLYFLRIPGLLTIIIWAMILSIAVFLIAGAFMLYSLSDTWRNDGSHSASDADGMLYVSYFVMALAALYLCLILVLGKRINMAVSIVKEAARALGSMPTLIFSPIIQIVGLVIFLVPWFIYMLYIASAGDMSTDPVTGARVFTYDQNSKYAFLYMLFCWFWTSEFLVACGQIVLALAISCWYFTRDKKETGQATVTWAFKSLFWYHLGTAAFGSLVIAIILTIRAVISYIQRKAKKSGNKILEYVMCILQCCMWCLEKIMRFLNKNAYIQTAIYGYSFCKACRCAFFLLLRNILRVAAVNMVADFVLLLGKLFVPVVTTFFLYCVFGYAIPSTAINGIVAPLVFTFILAYFVSVMFSEIFGMAIETILCCFIADEEMFPPEKRFAEGGLQSAISKTAQANAGSKVAVAETEAVEAKPAEEAML